MTWKTAIKNDSGTAIMVNALPTSQGQRIVLKAGISATVTVPEVGTVTFTEPGADDFHKYINTTWAVKVTAGSYVRYWGYEGGPTLEVVINNDRTFSLPDACNISFSHVPLNDHPLTQYSGVYTTNTAFWGNTFSPIWVNDDGTIFVGDSTCVITPSYDPTTATLGFDWTPYRGGSFKGFFSLVGTGSNITLTGTIWPRPQDGGLSMNGILQTLFAKPSLANIHNFDDFLKDGDVIDLRTQPSHLPLVLDASKRLIQASSGDPQQFTVKFLQDADGFALLYIPENKYLGTNDANELIANADEFVCSIFHLYMCMDGDVMIGTGDPSIPSSNMFMKRDPVTGVITLSTTTFLNADREFTMSFPNVMRQQPANRALQADLAFKDAVSGSVGDPLPCEIVNLQIIAHCTVGFLPLLGLGAYTWTSAIKNELKAFADANQAGVMLAIQPGLEMFKRVLTGTNVGQLALANAAAALIRAIYDNGPKLISKLFRIVWENFGFWDYAKAFATFTSWFLMPENPLAWQAVLINFAVWFTTAATMKDDAMRCLGN